MDYTGEMESGEPHHEQRRAFPLHDLGEAFFAITRIENGDAYFFDGIHRHDFYEVLWFTEVASPQMHYIDFNQYAISPNQVFLLLPDQVHSMEQRDKKGIVMGISRDFFEKMIGNELFRLFRYSTNFSVTIPDEKLPVLTALTELIRVEYASEQRPAILEAYLRSWFLQCIEMQKESADGMPRDARLQMLLELIETHYRRQRKSEFYANELSLSAKRLNELTRDSFGKTISQMINERLILEAKREIGFLRKPIKEISYELGFSEPAYFTRFFGKQTGSAPEDFRKKIAAMYNP